MESGYGGEVGEWGVFVGCGLRVWNEKVMRKLLGIVVGQVFRLDLWVC